MKCPKLVHHRPIPAGWEEAFFGDCIKADCSLWLDDIQMCAERDLALELRYIQFRLQEIRDKIPPARE